MDCGGARRTHTDMRLRVVAWLPIPWENHQPGRLPVNLSDIIKAGANVTTFLGLAGVCIAVVAATVGYLIKKNRIPAISKAASAPTINRVVVGAPCVDKSSMNLLKNRTINDGFAKAIPFGS
jgi:hypothetical protein